MHCQDLERAPLIAALTGGERSGGVRAVGGGVPNPARARTPSGSALAVGSGVDQWMDTCEAAPTSTLQAYECDTSPLAARVSVSIARRGPRWMSEGDRLV